MAEASAHKLSFVPEAVRGTTPTNPRFQALPDSRTTLALTRETLATERLSEDRFPAEPRSGVKGVSGDIPVDLSNRVYDSFIASALQGAWVESGDLDAVSIDQDGMGPVEFAENGPSATTNNGIVSVEFLDSKIEKVVLVYTPSTPAPAETYTILGLGSVTIDGETFETLGYTPLPEVAEVKAGDTRLSFSFLREFSDFDGGEKPFLLFNGCEVATWNLSAAANGIAKSTFTFWGRNMIGPSATAPTNTSVAPSIDTQIFDTFSGSLEIDGVETCIVTDYNITVNNGHAPRYGIGCDVSGDASVNMSAIDGSITMYFENADMYEKFVNEESIALRLKIQDQALNSRSIYLPNLKVGSGTQPDVSGDGPIMITINFTAHKDDTLGSHMSVTRVHPEI